MRLISSILLASTLFLATLTQTAFAAEPQKDIPPDPLSDPLLMAAGFLDSHPDLRYRSLAMDEYIKQNYAEAMRLFKLAGYYSDKPSQAIVGEMLWIGQGAEQDRAHAYIWMELAAERDYRFFSEKRDMYWSQLSAAERELVLEKAPAIRNEYADATAEKRLATILRRERAQMTGSRVGSQANPVTIVVPGVGTIEGSRYYAPRYWDPKEYRAWNDSFWKDVRIGRVDVGDVQQIQTDDKEQPAQQTEPNPAKDPKNP